MTKTITDEKFASGAIENEIRYLNLLAEKFPTIQDASTEIINLEAILNLPKGTEHFLTDIHGEYDTFNHVLRNASGVVRRKIDDVFGRRIRESEKRKLATIIYYPEEKLDIILKEEKDVDEWFSIALQRLVEVARVSAEKYTRSKVRKAMPTDFAYIIDELLNESGAKKQEYFNGIIQTIIDIKRARHFIIAISKFIQRLLIDRLHIIGDIFDRGPSPDKVMDALMEHHSVDIQWGNHDIIWMGAAAGIDAHIATVVRIQARYENLDVLEDAYGISLLPLATFAMETYADDECPVFIPKSARPEDYSNKRVSLVKKMQKAIAIIEQKLEGQIIMRNPDFDMGDRMMLDKIDYKKGTIKLNGKVHELLDKNFPTVDPLNPFALSEEEKELMEKLRFSFMKSEKLQRHVKFLFAKGNMYLAYNSNLLFHGCIPMTDDGKLESIKVENKQYSGKAMCDIFDKMCRRAYFNREMNGSTEHDKDYMWYLWQGAKSPLFGKKKMATFERYWIEDKETHKEVRNAYYNYRDQVKYVDLILKEFKLDPQHSHIINGHVPVKVKKGELPVKANGKLFVIDGGMSRPYQKVTGIAGYTLIYNSYSLVIVAHEPFESRIKAITDERDIVSQRSMVEQAMNRIRVGDTDIGIDLKKQIRELKMLLVAYRKGLIKERR